MKKKLTKLFSLVLTLAMLLCLTTLVTKPVAADSDYNDLDTYPFDSTLWTGIETYFNNTGAFDDLGYKVISVTSSNPKVIKVKREGSKSNINNYWLLPKKAGKATITVKYKTNTGKEKTDKLIRRVKPCPEVFKSMKVNGKTVDLSEHKVDYDAKYTGTKPKVKLELNDDWQIIEKYGWLSQFDKNGNWLKDKEFKVKARKTLYTGKALSFPKKWDSFGLNLVLENDDGDQYVYRIMLNRKTF